MEVTLPDEAAEITLGPVLFHWRPETWRDFYYRIADEAPVDIVYLGETVCSKRDPFLEPHYAAAAERLTAAGKSVVFSTLAEVMLKHDRQLVERICSRNDYPVEANEYEALRDALEKLHLNDASFHYEPETSQALGFGFRCGFLGLLHMDIVQERLEREYGQSLITTAPSVVYEVKLRDGTVEQVSNPSRLPPAETIEEFREPIMACRIFVPQEYVGPVITLCTDKRGMQTNMHYSARHVVISYDLPLNEVVLDFFDRLKSATRGYGSLDYEFKEYRPADMVRLDILVNGERVDALSSMVHRSGAQHRGRELVNKLRTLITRQMFDVPIQAAIGGHIIARENGKALRKNVLAKCYGGDVTRKRKLLEKQKEGKKRMKQVGAVEIPQEAFLAVLQRGQG